MKYVRDRLQIFIVVVTISTLPSSACRRSTPQWLKGNLHTHTSRSDGDTQPERVVLFYKEHGYRFLALTDHNAYTDPKTLGKAADDLVLLGAEEVSAVQDIHVGAIGITRVILPRRDQSRRLLVLDNVAAVRDAGGIPIIHHPQRSRLSAAELDVVQGGLFMLEIAEDKENRTRSNPVDPNPAEQIWDQLLTAGKPVLAVASDDAHAFDGEADQLPGPGTAWIMARASRFDPDGVLLALRRGDFYASTGVTLNDIVWDGRTFAVHMETVREKQYRAVFVGATGRVLAVSSSNPAVYSVQPTDHYVRVRVEGDDGSRAWTQPVRVTRRPEFEPRPLESPVAQGEVAAVNPAATGPVVPITQLPSAASTCDGPPENTVAFGERLLAERRGLAEGAYAAAARAWVVKPGEMGGDLRTVVTALRRRYAEVIDALAAVPVVRGVDVRHVTYEYPADYDGNENPVRVATRVITLRAVSEDGEERSLVVTYMNYDKIDPATRAVVLAMTPGAGARLALGLVDGGGYTGAALGRLAVRGLPLVTYDETGTGESSPIDEWKDRLPLTVTDLAMLDRVVLRHFGRVDLLGGCASLAPLLARHESRVKSAYVAGQCIPLWTRNDAAEGMSSPFGSDPETHDPVFQNQFQWADFLLMAGLDGVELALALRAGGSGLGKAGVLHEVMPVLQRFQVEVELRGDDPDGDGMSARPRLLCDQYDVADFADFLNRSRQPESDVELRQIPRK